MIDFEPAIRALHQGSLAGWADALPRQLEIRFLQRRHGDLPKWLQAIRSLPDLGPGECLLDQDQVAFIPEKPIPPMQRERLHSALQALHPWRKGPYRIGDLLIDTEWRSDWKWQRIERQITPLEGRRVLDVGCGNGYHGWRMLGAGAELVIGIDPTQLFLAQFLAMRRYLGADHPFHLLPLGIEDLPPKLAAFDSLFSMGVLYHRRSPIDHILELRDALRSGGELVLETLVIDGPEGQVLVPPGRYAKMRNVWFIPSPPTLEAWLERCGFRHVRLADLSLTTPEEQRSTSWMRFESLPDFLDPRDPRLTIEGHPAPRRAVFIAEAP